MKGRGGRTIEIHNHIEIGGREFRTDQKNSVRRYWMTGITIKS